MDDKYGVGDDPYCYPGTFVLRNRLGLQDEAMLDQAERELSEIAAGNLSFEQAPYRLSTLQDIHKALFFDLYDWAGSIRTVKIRKDQTLFCAPERIVPEATKIFASMESANWFCAMPRTAFIQSVAEAFGDLNVIHPFREGNGRAQRILFEQLIVNAGLSVDWWCIDESAWIPANIAAVMCDYRRLEDIFDRCIEGPHPV
jgi:cell filamentation protein